MVLLSAMLFPFFVSTAFQAHSVTLRREVHHRWPFSLRGPLRGHLGMTGQQGARRARN
jgi:hypothetical protein